MFRPSARPSLLHVLFFFSGAAGLSYQMVWARMFAPGLGHEIPAVLAVVAAFMGGMALGAWALDRPLERTADPARWYSSLELLIGIWAFLLSFAMPAVNDAAAHLIGLQPSPLRHWSLAFLIPSVLLLPATAAMGATFPAMIRYLGAPAEKIYIIGGIYAANTLGAVAGLLLTTFSLLPGLGLQKTSWCLGSINLVCALGALTLRLRSAGKSAPGAGTRWIGPRRLTLTLVATGLLGIGYEVIGVRVLAQVVENTVYSFTAVLVMFLVGTSIGAAVYQRFGIRRRPEALLTELLGLTSLTCSLGILALAKAQTSYGRLRDILGAGTGPGILAEILLAGMVFLLPTICMGALFSHLIEARRSDRTGKVGRAFAWNTLGCALAPVTFGICMLPSLGSKWSLVTIAGGYLLVIPRFVRWQWVIIPAAGVLTFLLPSELRILQMPGGSRVLAYREGVMASVAVIGDESRHRTLRVDNRFQMGGTAVAEAEYRHAHIPLLLHPKPQRGLFLGLGTGITFGAAALHPNLKADGVELVPEVVELMHYFAPENRRPAQQVALKVYIADARRFVRAASDHYDVIVADLFHPARDGAGSLYTVEHFRAIRDRLQPAGLFCQWLPLHQLDWPTLALIIRTFLEVFPDGSAWLLRFNVDAPVIGLIGFSGPASYSSNWIESRLTVPELETEIRKLALADSLRFFGNLIAGPQELRDLAGIGPLNSDDQPRVAFGAPRFVYQQKNPSYSVLLKVLSYTTKEPERLLNFPSNAEHSQFAARLQAYLLARDVYLHGLVDETEARQAAAVDRFVESARLSADFTPGYARCLTLASLEAKAKPDSARALLERLVEAQPSRPVARQLLERLFETSKP